MKNMINMKIQFLVEIFTIIKNNYEEWRIKNDESYNKENPS